MENFIVYSETGLFVPCENIIEQDFLAYMGKYASTKTKRKVDGVSVEGYSVSTKHTRLIEAYFESKKPRTQSVEPKSDEALLATYKAIEQTLIEKGILNKQEPIEYISKPKTAKKQTTQKGFNSYEWFNKIQIKNPLVPVLENTLLKDGLLIKSDLQVCWELGGFEIKAPICIPSKWQAGLSPTDICGLQIDTTNYMVRNGGSKVAGENANDFPVQEKVEGFKTTISAKEIGYLKKAVKFASTDELRVALMGVQWNNKGIAGTDGHKLYKIDITREEEFDCLLTKRLIETLPVLDFEVTISGSKLIEFINTEYRIRIVGKLIDERYPDIRNAIPLENPNSLEIYVSDFKKYITEALKYANKTTNGIWFTFHSDCSFLNSEDLNYETEYREVMLCEYTGEATRIGFNGKFLLDILSKIDDDVIKLTFSTVGKPATIKCNDGSLYLIMPFMVTNSPSSYKMRAECQHDIDVLLEKYKDFFDNTEVKETGFPDVVMSFTSTLSLNEIRYVLDTIPDGHVMFQSVNYADKYTGERYFEC